MVQFRAFSGYTFKPQLYSQLLDKDLQNFQEHQKIGDLDFEELLQEGVLQESNKKCMYLYEQQCQSFTSLGIVGELSLRDYQHNHIKKHEHTLPQQNQHYNHPIAETHVAPVVVGHRPCPQIDVVINKIREGKKCMASWGTADGRKHKLWKIIDHFKLTILYQQLVNILYILDGHHRFQAALQHLQRQGKNAKDKDEWMLAIVYSSQYVRSLPILRELTDPYNQEIIQKIMQDSQIQLHPLNQKPQQLMTSAILMIHNQKYYHITEAVCLNKKAKIHHINQSTKLSVELLREILERNSIVSEKGQPQIKDTPHIECKQFLYTQVQLKNLLRPNPVFIAKSPQVEQIFNRADNNKLFPAKSTWFEPKPCSHMIIRLPY